MVTGGLNRLKVLFHIDESGRWDRVLTNVTNFLNDVGPGQAEVEVVANGEAVTVFAVGSLGGTGQLGSAGEAGQGAVADLAQALGPTGEAGRASSQTNQADQLGSTPGLPLIDRMNELAHMGVRFAACRNALRSHSISEDRLPEFCQVVPAGITEIAKKQTEGYAYIKP
ncbi:MAG: DsrE family protein [Clostridia bacterium]|nr:DsrE family protein [Clostridia bacterium]